MLVMVLFGFFLVFIFKQKTAYEMRISDWSSDVCSSDLKMLHPGRRRAAGLGKGRSLDAGQRAGDPHSRRRHSSARRGGKPEARRQAALHRPDPGNDRTRVV